jgi:adenosylcobinamide kinase/adenosylcobinamide-phosphate guanylyltransferase
MVLVDCLTLWVSQLLMPRDVLGDGPSSTLEQTTWSAFREDLLRALSDASGPVVLVSNEIGSGVIPLGPEVRLVVDELGRLHQDVTQRCARITWMVAGQPFTREVERW